jgi:predicted nucleic acid-binding Zn ribbon protein
MTGEPRPLSAGIDRLLSSLRGGSRQATVTVFSRWTELVGEPVAAHVRPVKIDRGTLVVEVDDPAWATQMKFLESDLLNRLNAGSTRAVERLEIKVRRAR